MKSDLRKFFFAALFSLFALRPSPLVLAADGDPELTDLPLPKLVLPPEPPAGLRLPEPVVKDGEWRGLRCAVQEPRLAAFRHQDKWASFWQQAMTPYSPKLARVPQVDFDREMVVGVFLGEKGTPNFEIEIRKIRTEEREGGERVLVVRYKEIKKMQGVFTPPFAIQPYHLKKIPAFAGEVIFEKTR